MVGGGPNERPGSSSSPKIEPRTSPTTSISANSLNNLPRLSVEARLKQMQLSQKQEEIKVSYNLSKIHQDELLRMKNELADKEREIQVLKSRIDQKQELITSLN